MIVTEGYLRSSRRVYGQDELDYRSSAIPDGDFSWVEEYFDYLSGPPRPGVSPGDLLNVAVVFAFRRKIPVLPDNRTWVALHQQAGGIACEQHYFIATEIVVRQQLYGALRQIARDRWPGGRAGWDGRHFAPGAVAAYRSELARINLAYSGEWLTESIYPIDATQRNLDVISEEPLTLAGLGADNAAKARRIGASILILAPNSD